MKRQVMVQKCLKTRNCVIKKAHFDRTTLFGVFKTLYRSMYFRSCSLTKLFKTFFTSYSLIKIEVVIRYYGWLEINLYFFHILISQHGVENEVAGIQRQHAGSS